MLLLNLNYVYVIRSKRMPHYHWNPVKKTKNQSLLKTSIFMFKFLLQYLAVSVVNAYGNGKTLALLFATGKLVLLEIKAG